MRVLSEQPESPAPANYALAASIKRKARELGFDLVGIASPEPSKYRDYFHRWLQEGRSGTMDYLGRRFEEKTDPGNYFPGVQSIICVGLNYFAKLKDETPATNAGKIARYALGDDYHELIKPRLHALADWLKAIAPSASSRCAVDTAPVMEKELATRAAIGWQGKNTCIINESIGSWIFLGEILTTLPLPADNPATDRCGTCRRCIDACPTQAITEPYQLDASRCISYLTIEHRGEIAGELAEKIAPWVYGCDICQDVCPWNREPPETNEEGLRPRFPAGTVDLAELNNWTPDDYRAAEQERDEAREAADIATQCWFNYGPDIGPVAFSEPKNFYRQDAKATKNSRTRPLPFPREFLVFGRFDHLGCALTSSSRFTGHMALAAFVVPSTLRHCYGPGAIDRSGEIILPGCLRQLARIHGLIALFRLSLTHICCFMALGLSFHIPDNDLVLP